MRLTLEGGTPSPPGGVGVTNGRKPRPPHVISPDPGANGAVPSVMGSLSPDSGSDPHPGNAPALERDGGGQRSAVSQTVGGLCLIEGS
jgi:hypothetical protein